jgi:hypothetical protein
MPCRLAKVIVLPSRQPVAGRIWPSSLPYQGGERFLTGIPPSPVVVFLVFVFFMFVFSVFVGQPSRRYHLPGHINDLASGGCAVYANLVKILLS